MPEKLKIACVAISEMGHFIPMSHIADALIKRGHDVYFITNSDAYNDHKSSKIMTAIGCTNQVFTDDGMIREDLLFKKPKNLKNDNHIKRFFDLFRDLVKIEIQKINPDIIVCDFYTRVGIHVADDLGIPSVVNVPGMLEMFQDMGISGIFDLKNSSSCCGQICFSQPFKHWAVYKFIEQQNDKPRYAYMKSYNRRVVLFNSFWGLDKACSVPPNFTLTGPLSPPQHDLLKAFEQKDPELFKWMNDAYQNNQKVVFISLGSICSWEDWSVKAMFDGLKKVGCKVVWSLKDRHLPEEDPNFYVSTWVPQIELLAHPALKAGLTHCGFGGTLEFIGAGVPIVAFPHFGDQSGNALELEKRQVAIILHDTKIKMISDLSAVRSVKQPAFDAEKVYKVFNEILTNELYSHNMKKQQKLSEWSGGRDEAVKIIEDTVRLGNTHLVDQQTVKHYHQLSCCSQCWSRLFLSALYTALLTFTLLQYI